MGLSSPRAPQSPRSPEVPPKRRGAPPAGYRGAPQKIVAATRAVGELLAELGVERSITTIIDSKLATYVDLDAAAIEAAGGDSFWPLPFWAVRP